jgi:hypothetical protein
MEQWEEQEEEEGQEEEGHAAGGRCTWGYYNSSPPQVPRSHVESELHLHLLQAQCV